MTREEFYEVAKIVRPGLVWQEYRAMWADFLRAKRAHLMEQRGMRVIK